LFEFIAYLTELNSIPSGSSNPWVAARPSGVPGEGPGGRVDTVVSELRGPTRFVAYFPVGSECELQESVVAVAGCACFERGLDPPEVDVLFSTSTVVSIFARFADVLGCLALPSSDIFFGFASVRVPVEQSCVPTLADGPSGGFRKGCRACLCLLDLSGLRANGVVSVAVAPPVFSFARCSTLEGLSARQFCFRFVGVPAALADKGLINPTEPCSRGSPPLLPSGSDSLSQEFVVGRSWWRFVALCVASSVACFPAGSECKLQESVATVAGCACFERGCCFRSCCGWGSSSAYASVWVCREG
ncbi:hypothetical protein Taro_004856, partial [Colocasia esculenta]|nr:hypothetical protein [Colocasia esculenta]